MAIQFGVNTWTWVSPFRTEDARRIFPKVKEMGFDVVEIALEDPSLVEAEAVRGALDQNGLSATVCGAFGPSRDLASEELSVVQEGLDYIDAALNVAAELGSPILCGPMYSAVGKARHVPEQVRREEFNRAVGNLGKAATLAAKYGVKLAIEPLNRFETDMVNTAEQARKLVDAIGHGSVGIHLDTFHMNIEEESVYDAVKTAGKDLIHVHASESNRGTPGSAVAGWDDLARGLKEIGYNGPVVIETFTPEVKEIARAAAIWRPLAASQDALAADGLKFLKQLLS